MKESNELLVNHFELKNKVFLHQKISEGQRQELENQKRLSDIKPHFVYAGGGSNSEKFTVLLLNKGKTAKNIKLEEIDCCQVDLRQPDSNKAVEQNTNLEISGSANNNNINLNSNQVSFQVLIKYTDIDGNKYEQQLTRSNHKTQIDNPKKIEEE